MAEIEIRGVTKRYPDGTVAIRDLSLEVGAGELMILVGPSGCGKSTALRMVAGLEPITEGELLIGGQLVNDRPPKERDIAMVFQNYALYPHMTVERNMGFALTVAKVPKAAVAERVLEAARILDLEEHLGRRPGQLSGGQRQRVAMGRAIVRDPKAFLMDEPLSNLDAKLRVQMRVEIAQLQRRLGTTTLYVTHDQTEAMTLGDRVAVLRGGELQQVATPAQLYDTPANVFVAGFIGSPPMNLFDGTLADRAVDTPLGRLSLPEPLWAAAGGEAAAAARRAVSVGIRPESFADPALGAPPAGAVEAQLDVDLVESVGSDLYVYARANATALVARLPPASAAAAGNPIRLAVAPAAVKLFDAESGRAIRA
ncbi:ABC transporter ATP-binding protein [Conexibacter woesei]|uniref:ABC transporter related protein n=1 Tax=Conexibacter woesei (strain DSM 14684 / CCUG 47730 / CIP 108061 / JCM 11494 / NBRC 100937 / ID131577) TaxID=469383 RepID=D3F3N9_CONWI|nr:sn-glycerol-3-phosphate ABC transporter ATP-binding protein UgpC [Conexibacter woesei]ADB52404.1 ABC transporter related protein [Conexibacter woesei DSM 14684]